MTRNPGFISSQETKISFAFELLVAEMVKSLPEMQEIQVQSLGWENPLAKAMVTHSSVLAWRTPGQRSLSGYNTQGHKELDMTEQLSLSHIVVARLSLGSRWA